MQTIFLRRLSQSAQVVTAVAVLLLAAYLMLGLLRSPSLRAIVPSALQYSAMASNGEYVSGTHSMAFVTVPNAEVGKKLASGLVSNKLVACVNIIPGVTSIYEWEGKIEEDNELILMMKTRTSRMDEVSKYVRENHPYDVAEVISAPIDKGNPPYLEWIGKIVTDSAVKGDA